MRRRDFITLLGSAAAAWPLAGHAQQPAMPVIGFLSPGSASDFNRDAIDGFRRGLAEWGYVEGRNVAIDYRWAEGHYERLPELAADLVNRRMTVIAATGTSAPGLAVKAATTTIPIVFQTGGDPVADGLVASMNRPGNNVTGVSRLNLALDPKRLEKLHELLPNAKGFAVLVNRRIPRMDFVIRQVEKAAQLLRLKIQVVKIDVENDLESTFATMARQGVDALLVSADPSMGTSLPEQLAALALRYGIPTMFGNRRYVSAGGLMSYDASITDSYRQAGAYVGRILSGEKPGDLPVLEPIKFDLVINLKTAKALGLTISREFLLLADEVIE